MKGRGEIPATYSQAVTVMKLAKAGIGLADAEAMDAYTLGAVIDLLNAQEQAEWELSKKHG